MRIISAFGKAEMEEQIAKTKQSLLEYVNLSYSPTEAGSPEERFSEIKVTGVKYELQIKSKPA
jgi:hypothetical protein